jgi:hypothetical protein
VSSNELGLKDGAAAAVQQVISRFHMEAHDRVVNIKNTVQGVVDDGSYAGAGATATVEKMGMLQKYWDTELEPILTALFEKVGGVGEALAAQDQIAANAAQSIEIGTGGGGPMGAGSGMAQKAGRL